MRAFVEPGENSRLYQETQQPYDELSQTQDQLAQASKMETVGHLAGGVAHEDVGATT